MAFSDILSDPKNQIGVQGPTSGVDYGDAIGAVGRAVAGIVDTVVQDRKVKKIDQVTSELQEKLIPWQQVKVQNPQRVIEANLQIDNIIKDARARYPTLSTEIDTIVQQNFGLQARGNAVREQTEREALAAKVDNDLRNTARSLGMEQYDEQGNYDDKATLNFMKRVNMSQLKVKNELSFDQQLKQSEIRTRKLIQGEVEKFIVPALDNIRKASLNSQGVWDKERYQAAATNVKMQMDNMVSQLLLDSDLDTNGVKNIKDLMQSRFKEVEDLILSDDRGTTERFSRAVANAAEQAGVDIVASAPQLKGLKDEFGPDAVAPAMLEVFTNPVTLNQIKDMVVKGYEANRSVEAMGNIFNPDYVPTQDKMDRTVQGAAARGVKEARERGEMKDTPQNMLSYLRAVRAEAKLVSSSNNTENHRRYPDVLAKTLPQIGGMLNNAETADEARAALDDMVRGLESSVSTTRRLLRDSYGDDILERVEYNPNTNSFNINLKAVKEGTDVRSTVTGAIDEAASAARRRALARDLPFLQKALDAYGKVEAMRRGIPEVEARKAMMQIGGVPTTEIPGQIAVDEEGMADPSAKRIRYRYNSKGGTFERVE